MGNRSRGQRINDVPDLTLATPSERALLLFGIDINASLKAWMTDMVGEERADELMARDGQPSGFVIDRDLTQREREILSCLACGYTREETGELLFITGETVKSHLKRVYRVMRATNMLHAIVLAALTGELEEEILQEHLFRGYESPGLARPGRPVAA